MSKRKFWKDWNIFEKKFFLIDSIATGGIYGKGILLLKFFPNSVNILISITMLFFWYLMRKRFWNMLEKQEKEWIRLELPKELFFNSKFSNIMANYGEVIKTTNGGV